MALSSEGTILGIATTPNFREDCDTINWRALAASVLHICCEHICWNGALP